MKIDEATGLPALPDGQFWRIERTAGGLWLRLMERSRVIVQSAPRPGRFLWSRPIAGDIREIDTSHEIESHPIICDVISPLDAARRILYGQGLLGDYPPKRLPDD